MKTIVTKKQYAESKNRTISAVSHWIKTGRISPEALQGDGVRAKIWVERADLDLANALDPAKQAAQDVPVAPTVLAPTGFGVAPSLPSSSGSEDPDIRRRRSADADRAVEEAIAARRRNEIESGRWVDASDVRKEFGHELAKLIGAMDTFVGSTLARAIADRFGLEWKDISLVCRSEYRKFRSEGAEQTAAELAAHETDIAAAASEEVIDDVPGRPESAGVGLRPDRETPAAVG